MVDAHSTLAANRDVLARQVDRLLVRLHPTVTFERRAAERMELPLLLRLVPLDEFHSPLESATVTVVGKNISRRGLCFYHDQPLPYRRALISAQLPDGEPFAVEVDISWCRFTKPGWYESGGRLIAIVPAA